MEGKNNAGLILPETTHGVIHQTADKLYNIDKIEKAGEIHNSVNIYMPGAEPKKTRSLDLSRYHLFVISCETFEHGFFTMTKDRILNAGTSAPLKAEFPDLSATAFEKLRHYPAVFMSETNYQLIKDGQLAYFGILEGIKEVCKGINVHFKIFSSFPAVEVTSNMWDLDILGQPFFGELTHTHWALKDINVVEVLKKHGVSVLLPSM